MTNPNGRFGIHGGQYIPETLMNAVIELEQAYNHYKDDPEFNAELTRLFNDYANRPSRAVLCRKDDPGPGRRKDLSEAGGPEPHGRPQNQQRSGPGAAGQKDGQDPPDRPPAVRPPPTPPKKGAALPPYSKKRGTRLPIFFWKNALSYFCFFSSSSLSSRSQTPSMY